jgi:hypothetical protein
MMMRNRLALQEDYDRSVLNQHQSVLLDLTSEADNAVQQFIRQSLHTLAASCKDSSGSVGPSDTTPGDALSALPGAEFAQRPPVPRGSSIVAATSTNVPACACSICDYRGALIKKLMKFSPVCSYKFARPAQAACPASP